MELRHLRYFVVVAEELNFRRAAERLRIAQPAVSAQIKSLEEKLGVRLFERTTRSVLLTPAGRGFLDEARRVLGAAAQAEQAAHQAHHGIVGSLRLGVIPPATSPRLAKVLRHFHQGFPGVQLALMELTSAEQLRRLRAGELDFGLLRPPVTFPELKWRFAEQSHQVLAAPAGHRLATKRTLAWFLRRVSCGLRQRRGQGASRAICPRHSNQDVAHLRRLWRGPDHGGAF
jgi:DNA-binding transcriptional LysR family regulator